MTVDERDEILRDAIDTVAGVVLELERLRPEFLVSVALDELTSAKRWLEQAQKRRKAA